jgi:hypothetical protein
MDAIAVRSHAWNTESRSGVGSTVDPKIESLNIGFSVHHREARLVPEGTESVPKDDDAGGLCEPGGRLTAVRTVCARRSGHEWFAVGNREPVALSWKRAELGPGGLAQCGATEVDRGPWLGSYVSDHRSGGAGGARPAPAGGLSEDTPG